jgi:hypothetical protein
MSTMTEVKERPILMSAPMVRAILSGAKTMTRRVVKPQPKHRAILSNNGKWYDADCINPGEEMICRFGNVGDRLWVKEAWGCDDWDGGSYPDSFGLWYAADPEDAPLKWVNVYPQTAYTKEFAKPGKSRSSLFMPRWASRLTLEITGVRAEQLQDITEADAKAEGCEAVPLTEGEIMLMGVDDSSCWPARSAFARLWYSIHGVESWDANPWVWVVSFKRLRLK